MKTYIITVLSSCGSDGNFTDEIKEIYSMKSKDTKHHFLLCGIHFSEAERFSDKELVENYLRWDTYLFLLHKKKKKK